MISHPLILLAVLTGFVTLLWRLSDHSRYSRLFRMAPLPLWCYLIPTLATTFGLLPAESSIYGIFSRQLLPVCLVLLLIGTDLKKIVHLGPLAMGLMLCGSVGTILGGLSSFLLFRHWLPEGSWAAIGALTASWIGGSANLLAVKEALDVSDSLIGAIIIVDALVAYSWMALLIWASGFQTQWQRFFDARHQPYGAWHPSGPSRFVLNKQAFACALSLLISFVAQRIALNLPIVGSIFNPASWTILLITTASLALSLTPLKQLEQAGASRLGTFLLYLLLASIGARADLKTVFQTPTFLALGLTWIAIHGICLFLAGILLKAPLGLIATASQANIGGTVSAPIVGATYHPNLSGVGLLMAILGNILGTYLGLFASMLAHRIA